MDGESTEICFALAKPLIGRSPGRLCVSPSGEVRIEHRFLRRPIILPISSLAVVARQDDLEPLLPIDPGLGTLDLPVDARKQPNAVLVVRSPMQVGLSRFGAQSMGFRYRQATNDMAIDVLTATFDEPELLLEALAARGVGRSEGLARALTAAAAHVPPELAAKREEALRREDRRRTISVIGLVAVTLLAGGFALGDAATTRSWATMGRVGAATLAGSLAIALVLTLGMRSTNARRARWWSVAAVAGPALVPVGITLLRGVDRFDGAQFILALAAPGAIVGGSALALGLRFRDTRRGGEASDPVVFEPSRRWPLVAVTTVLALGVFVAAVVAEHAADAPVRRVSSALVDAAALPPGWVACCGDDQASRGQDLDEHICGSDDDELPAHVAAVVRYFQKPIPDDHRFIVGQFNLTVLLAASEEAAIAEFAAIDSPGYLDCTTRSVGRLAGYWQPRGTGEADVDRISRAPVSGIADAIIDTFVAVVPVDDKIDTSFIHFVRMRVGSAIVRMPVQSLQPSWLDPGELQAIIEAAHQQVVGADLG